MLLLCSVKIGYIYFDFIIYYQVCYVVDVGRWVVVKEFVKYFIE